MKQKMTQKLRLSAAAKKQPVDRPPCICPGGMMNMMFADIMEQAGCLWPETHNDAKKMAELAYALNQADGFENYGVPFCMTVEAEAMGATVNMGNRLCEPHVVEPLLTSCAQIEKIKRLDLQTGRVATVLDAITILKGKNSAVPIIGNLTGPISVAGTLLDMSLLLREFRKSPANAQRYLDIICDNLIVFGKAQIEAGADAICISEPSGTGEILGPQNFANFTVNCLNKILDELNVSVKIVHICGRLKSVYDIIPQIRCDVFSFDAVVPIAEIKKHMTAHAVMGNISTFALGSMQPEKIASLVNGALTQGVDIVAPACGLSTTTPLINVQTMVDVTRTI
ncbi:MAG: MtaA/CmuA family methyltransferase [Veillonellales bacterium]